MLIITLDELIIKLTEIKEIHPLAGKLPVKKGIEINKHGFTKPIKFLSDVEYRVSGNHQFHDVISSIDLHFKR